MIKDQFVLDKIKALLRTEGVDPESVVIAQSHFLIAQAITNANSIYKFDIKKTGNEILTEVKLDRNDAFVVSEMGFGIKAVVSANVGKAKIATYPNQTVFPAVTTAGSEFTPDDLQVFWNSQLELKVGNTVHIPNLDTERFYYAPETQKSAATNYDQRKGSDGFIDLTPQIMLKGWDNISLKVEAPYFAGIKVANTNANTVNYLILQGRGYLIKELNKGN